MCIRWWRECSQQPFIFPMIFVLNWHINDTRFTDTLPSNIIYVITEQFNLYTYDIRILLHLSNWRHSNVLHIFIKRISDGSSDCYSKFPFGCPVRLVQNPNRYPLRRHVNPFDAVRCAHFHPIRVHWTHAFYVIFGNLLYHSRGKFFLRWLIDQHIISHILSLCMSNLNYPRINVPYSFRMKNQIIFATKLTFFFVPEFPWNT